MLKANKLKGSVLAIAIISSLFVLLSAARSSSNAAPSSSNAASAPAADGAAIYQAKCSTCHGKDGRGIPNWKAKGQPDFTESTWQKSRTDAQISDVTKNGKGKFMPAFKAKLSDEEVAAVVSRVRSFGKK